MPSFAAFCPATHGPVAAKGVPLASALEPMVPPRSQAMVSAVDVSVVNKRVV